MMRNRQNFISDLGKRTNLTYLTLSRNLRNIMLTREHQNNANEQKKSLYNVYFQKKRHLLVFSLETVGKNRLITTFRKRKNIYFQFSPFPRALSRFYSNIQRNDKGQFKGTCISFSPEYKSHKHLYIIFFFLSFPNSPIEHNTNTRFRILTFKYGFYICYQYNNIAEDVFFFFLPRDDKVQLLF